MPAKLRTLASDTLIYGLFMIIGRFLTFMLTPLYANALPMDVVGDIYYIFSIFAFLNILFSFGMEAAFFRFYDHDDVEQSRKVFSNSFFTILLIAGSISTLIFVLAPLISGEFTTLKNPVLSVRLAAYIPFLDAIMLIPYAYLRMIRKARRFSSIRFVVIILAVSLNLIFLLQLNWGAEAVFAAQLIANVCGMLLLSTDILKNLVVNLDKKLIKAMLVFGLPTLPASLSSIFLQIGDRPILKYLTDEKAVGLYSINYRLGIPMMLMVTVFEYAWKPFYLSHYKEEGSKNLFARVLTYFTLLAAGIFLLAGLYMEYAVQIPAFGSRIIPPEYWSALSIIPIILGGYYFNGVFTNFAAGFYIEKKTKYLPVAIGTAAVVNIVMNFILIPLVGVWGAAWATLGAYFVSALVLYLFLRNIYPMPYEWRRILIIILSTLAVYFAAMYFSDGMEILSGIVTRTVFILGFILLLKIFGFFTKSEIEGIKRLFKRG